MAYSWGYTLVRALGGVCFFGGSTVTTWWEHSCTPKKGKPKTLFANRGGVGLRARGFGPIPLASKQASMCKTSQE